MNYNSFFISTQVSDNVDSIETYDEVVDEDDDDEEE